MYTNPIEKWEQEIKNARHAERDIQRITGQPFAKKVIDALEEERKKCLKASSLYTQKYVAEQAGISPSTYKGYVAGRSHHIDLITAKGIADVLGCRLADIILKAES